MRVFMPPVLFFFFPVYHFWGFVLCLIQQQVSEAARCSEKQARLLDLFFKKMSLLSTANTSDFIDTFHLNINSVYKYLS